MSFKLIKRIVYSVLLIVIYFVFIRKDNPAKLISPFLGSPPSLGKVVEKALTNSKGTYALAIKNLKSGESFYLNEHKVFEAGSLYKIWLMAEAFRQIEGGILKEDEVLSEKIEVLNKQFNISSDSAELKVGEVTLSVKDAITQIITISHNYAALLLTEKVKLSLSQPPTTTPSDIALFLEKLYKGELVSQESSQKMIDLLKKQTLNDKLPKYLPKEISIAHKTGEIGYFTHDAGIVFIPKGDYIIVVFSESDFPPGAKERIAQISKAVYDYFTK